MINSRRSGSHILSVVTSYGQRRILLGYALHRLRIITLIGGLTVLILLSLVRIRSCSFYKHLRRLWSLMISRGRCKLVLSVGTSVRHSSHTCLNLKFSYSVHLGLTLCCSTAQDSSVLTADSLISYWNKWRLSLCLSRLESLLLLYHGLQLFLRRAHQRWMGFHFARCLLLSAWKSGSLRSLLGLVSARVLSCRRHSSNRFLQWLSRFISRAIVCRAIWSISSRWCLPLFILRQLSGFLSWSVSWRRACSLIDSAYTRRLLWTQGAIDTRSGNVGSTTWSLNFELSTAIFLLIRHRSVCRTCSIISWNVSASYVNWFLARCKVFTI